MSAQMFTCPVCGFLYDSTAKGSCGTCPLNQGCEMVCCPNCGHSTIDHSQSRLVQFAMRLFPVRKIVTQPTYDDTPLSQNSGILTSSTPGSVPITVIHASQSNDLTSHETKPLIEMPVGKRVRVVGFGENLTTPGRARLQAYGVVPGYWVEVIQQSPVTVIQVDHLELAMENDFASRIWVTEG